MAVEPAEQSDHPVPGARGRPGEPRDGGLVTQVLEHRVLERELRARVVQLEHVAGAVDVEPEVEVALAGQRRRAPVEVVEVAGDSLGGVLAHAADLGSLRF